MQNVEFNPEAYYSRHFPLQSIGRKGQSLLGRTHVLIAGVGGLGTKSADLLVGLGIGKITLVDFDVVEMSNLPRQSLFTIEDIGKAKVDVAAERLQKRNPSVEIVCKPIQIDGLSVDSLLDDVDVIIDGLDRFSSRRPLHYHAMQRKIPYIFAGAVAETANLSTFLFEPEDPCMICIFGEAEDNPELTCEFQGVHPSILEIAASIQVAEAVKIVTGKQPTLKGKLLTIDLDELDFETITFAKNPKCTVCSVLKEEKGALGERKRYQIPLPNGKTAKVTSICGRNTYIAEISDIQNLDLNKFREGFKIVTSSENAISFEYRQCRISVLKSGLITIRGATSLGLAETILSKISKWF